MSTDRIRSRKPGEANRSGETYSSRSVPSAARCMTPSFVAWSCWALTSATWSATPRAWSASTWSCIRATSGETTTVRSERMSPGSW